ncbi:MAG TPA: ATP-binding protein [Nakamurella sp.]|nr:ATP-binding protein [Nakamurella sp.]
MTDPMTWLQANDRFLQMSMRWLRLRLERTAAQHPMPPNLGIDDRPSTTRPGVDLSAVPVPATWVPPQRRGWFRRSDPTVVLPSRAVEIVNETRAAPPAPDRNWDAEVADAAAAVAMARAGMSPPPALDDIGAVLELTEFEQDVLLLCAAPELDTGIGTLIADVQGQQWPSFALAMTVFDNAAWQSRSPNAPLRRWHVVESTWDDGRAISTVPLRADERVVNALKGLDHVDDRLTTVLVQVPAPEGVLPPSQQAVVWDAVGLVGASTGRVAPEIVQLVGPHASTRLAVAAHIAAGLNRTLYRLQRRLLPTAAADLDLLARLWHRETLLSDVALYVEDDDAASETARAAFLARTGGIVLIGSYDVAADLAGTSAVLDVAHPTAAEQVDLWRAALDPGSTADAGQLAEQFDLDADSIAMVVRHTGATPAGADPTEALRTAARQHLRPKLEAAAQRVQPPLATWDSLVLPDAELDLLHEISSQVAHRFRVYHQWGFDQRMNRGLGISALFAGDSGTGKSMAAEVLASDLGLDLYRIDLSAVVSKYIGETEKNLRGLFDAAQGGGVILFFDEADALFGKRSEVKDAHDRYANIETNYLLQRMEQFSGLAILATNMRSALDRAFARRLRFIVTFPFPTAVNRSKMWSRAFPPDVPKGSLDFDRLARIDLNGAGIANAALNAAFSAAAQQHDIGMDDVLRAARNELRKLDRPVNEAHFRLPAEATS